MALLAPALAAAATAVSVPFTSNVDGMVVLPAMLGSDRPIHVILDTGAGVDVLAPSLIEAAHGKPAGQFTGFRMFGDRLSLPLFVIPELTVGPLRKTKVVISSWDVLDQVHDDGIIAVRDLRSQPFTIDFPARSSCSRRSVRWPSAGSRAGWHHWHSTISVTSLWTCSRAS